MKTLRLTHFLLLIFISIFTCQSAVADKMINSASQETNDIKKMPATTHLDSIILGAGCFWGAEKRYAAIPGVIDAISGYADGKGVSPTYREITRSSNQFNPDNHAEVVKVIFNRSVVSLEVLLQSYFESHDPTQINRQGNDIGTQYRSTILTNSNAQTIIAQRVLNQYQVLLTQANHGKIATRIKMNAEFYPAEGYHQDYLVKNPKGYCPDHATGIKFSANQKANKTINNSAITRGKQIVIIESENYCPYCEKFKSDVSNPYKGTIPINYRLASQLEGLTIKTETWATPTILFIENGREVFGQQGYMSAKDFYKVLGLFKLGKSEAYNVAFNQGTDSKYCKQYEILKNTPDGLFVDKLSGEALFDTRDRFNSRSGWLSFTKPVAGSTYQLADNSYGMRRIEIRSKSSGIHLGHVFPDGPDGKNRYCINATVLEFKAR